ncbi:MAG: NADH-quinone oxidoreductase subunit NuoG [Fimbriimonadaceae bacterium]|nr:NADH-quinone oxidoreductase subunit NuoG [Alphaproteobacteria bacterium]
MPTLKVDGTEVEVPDGITLLQACEMAGAEIPRFCYHERLSIAGNCRMCLVEWVGAPKPQASCALSVNDLRPNRDGSPAEIRTNSPLVKKAREGVMEFLLINHPLDCPICDQGGECDLQDQAMAYGVDASRFAENKRAVEDKDIGLLVKTMMTRCIHCTRCVRFVTEVAGVPELGATGRGEDMEITTYLEGALSSELQGNVIDLCPVGALTSKPYEFTARPWELDKTETIDVMDALGSNIRVDTRGREVMRILPRINDAVNEEWISDKTRFIWDGLRTQRLDQPYVRKGGKLTAASWDEAFAAIAGAVEKTDPQRIGAIAGDLASAEDMFAFKDLMTRLGVASVDCRQDGAPLDPANGRASYLFNSTIEGVEQADAILLIGTNPRYEASVMNARIRKNWLRTGLAIGVIGGVGNAPGADLTYDYEYLGAGPETLAELTSGKNKFFDKLNKAKHPMIIVGQGALARKDGAGVLAAAAKLADSCGALLADWNGFNVLHTAASRVAGLDLGFLPAEGGRDVAGICEGASGGDIDVVFLLGADEVDGDKLGKAFVVYQGTHGDRGAHRADVILPGAAYTEKNATYVNTEGRPQMALRAAFPPGDAREDWAILRALSERLGQTLPYDNFQALRAAMYEVCPHLAAINQIEAGDPGDIAKLAASGGRLGKSAFPSAIKDFYLTNPIARASAVMSELSAMATARKKGASGTHG